MAITLNKQHKKILFPYDLLYRKRISTYRKYETLFFDQFFVVDRLRLRIVDT